MGKIDSLDVILTSPTNNNIFFAGQQVTGVLRLRLSGSGPSPDSTTTRIRQIRLEIFGRAATRWTRPNGRYTSVYKGEEVYLNCRVVVWPLDEQPAPRDDHLPAGSYEFPFVFDIPPNCPGSFEGPYGNIRYFCKAIIDQPWSFDQKFKTMFNVISILDLNTHPDAVRPLKDAKLKKIGLLNSGGQIECMVDIERCGYVPGEKIPTNFTVTNNSSKVIKLIVVKLEERGWYTGAASFFTSTKGDVRLVAEMKSNEGVQPGRSQIWNGYSLPIPPINASILNSRIINITYKLIIEVLPVMQKN
uniref:Arrestin C-terminal-like domain-containing protein n=1 Tax=Romanomermis culicivorax TaxID=13658 RepID=A0A915ITU7_ROMCU